MNNKDREFIQSNYLAYVMYMFQATHGGLQFVKNKHHVEIADKLSRVITGEIKRLVICMPPRYSKTEMAVVMFISYCMGLFPDSEFIHASYSKRLATNNSYNTRAVIMNEAFSDVFPDVGIRHDSKAKDEWKTTHGGVMYATGAEGTITGYGAGKMRAGFGGAVIIDDPHKAGEAESNTMRENVIEWYKSTMTSRMNSPETPMIVIMQRLHQKDLAGWLMAGGSGEEWDTLIIPVEDEEGNPLWTEKHDGEALAAMRVANPYGFAGQYMQAPAPREGAMIKREWVKRYSEAPFHPIMIVQSWDTAYKDKQINDPSVCTTWAVTNNGYFLLDVFRKRMNYPELKKSVVDLYIQFNPGAVLIEDKASGQALIQELKTNTMVPAISVIPEGDKVTRMNAESSYFEAGLVHLPENAEWLPVYEEEIHTFPMAANDDQVDSTSQFLKWIRSKAGQYSDVIGTGNKRTALEAFDGGEAGIDEFTGFGRVRGNSGMGDF